MRNRGLKGAFGLILLMVCGGAWAGNDPLAHWIMRFPSPQVNTLRGVAYGTTNFVAVGDGGTVITSPDGYQWSVQSSGVSSQLNAIAYADGQFAAVGQGGVVLVSPDGANWTQMPTATTANLNGISGTSLWLSRHLSQFMAVGDGGVGVACTYGTNWYAVSTGTSNTLFAVAPSLYLGKAYYVSVGVSGTIARISNSGLISVVDSGLTSANNNFYSITARAGTLVAGGDLNLFWGGPDSTNRIFSSRNAGGTWQSYDWVDGVDAFGDPLWGLSEMFVLTGVTYGASGYVGVGYTGYGLEYHPAVLLNSVDGSQWIELPSSTCENGLNAVTFGNGTYVAVGDFGSIVVSTNATNWSEVIPDRRGAIVAMAGNTNLAIAASLDVWYSWGFPDFRTLVSTDGVNWAVSRTKKQLAAMSDLDSDGKLFVGVGAYNILETTDGYTWQTNMNATNLLHGVRWCGDRFVAVGDAGTLLSSGDGTSWTRASLATQGTLNGVAYGKGMFVAAGGVSATSTDGVNWAIAPTNPPAIITRIAYGNDLFVATAYDQNSQTSPTGRVLTSRDGVAWQSQFVEPNGQAFGGVAYSAGVFVAISSYDGFTYSSVDGVNWRPLGTRLPWGLYRYYTPFFPGVATTVCAFKGSFLIGGMEGVLLQSDQVGMPALLGCARNGIDQVSISYTQQLGVPYRLQTSSNLVDWNDLLSSIGSGILTNVIVPALQNSSAQFFRLITP